MKFLLPLIPLLFLGLAIFGPLLDKGKSRRERERTVTIRLTLLMWFTAACLVGGLVFLPEKGRVLMLLPVYALLAGTRAYWRRLLAARGPEPSEVDLQKMKRARPARRPMEHDVN